MTNPLNCRPLFTQEQLSPTLRVSHTLAPPSPSTNTILDVRALHNDIRNLLVLDPTSSQVLATQEDKLRAPWTVEEEGLLLLRGKIFVLDVGNLRLRVLQGKHDHPLAGHFGQEKTLQLVRQDYTWPNLRHFVQDYVNSCSTCLCNKSRHHPPYSHLKQLPIPSQP